MEFYRTNKYLTSLFDCGNLKVENNLFMKETKYNTPKNSSRYAGEYIVFDSERKNPRVLYHSSLAADSYKKAEQIKKESEKAPTIVRIPETKHQLVKLCLEK